jgi:hypothetical protein
MPLKDLFNHEFHSESPASLSDISGEPDFTDTIPTGDLIQKGGAMRTWFKKLAIATGLSTGICGTGQAQDVQLLNLDGTLYYGTVPESQLLTSPSNAAVVANSQALATALKAANDSAMPSQQNAANPLAPQSLGAEASGPFVPRGLFGLGVPANVTSQQYVMPLSTVGGAAQELIPLKQINGNWFVPTRHLLPGPGDPSEGGFAKRWYQRASCGGT